MAANSFWENRKGWANMEPMEVGAYYKRKSDGELLGQFIKAEKLFIHPNNSKFMLVSYTFTENIVGYVQSIDILKNNPKLINPPKPIELERVNQEDVYIPPLYENANNSNITQTAKSPFTPGRRGAHGGHKTRRRSPRRKTQKRRR